MSQPSLPPITPTINISRNQVQDLLLASIGMEELSLAHLLNAEAEKNQFVLGTLFPSQSASPIAIEDLLNVNGSIHKTLRDIVKQEMLLQFKLENVISLGFSEPIPPQPEERCRCSADFVVDTNTAMLRNGTETGIGQLSRRGPGNARARVCRTCNPVESELFNFNFDSTTNNIVFVANTYNLNPDGTIGSCCRNEAAESNIFTITGTGTRNNVSDIPFTLILSDGGQERFILILNGTETFTNAAPLPAGQIDIDPCPGVNLDPCD